MKLGLEHQTPDIPGRRDDSPSLTPALAGQGELWKLDQSQGHRAGMADSWGHEFVQRDRELEGNSPQAERGQLLFKGLTWLPAMSPYLLFP